MAGFTATSWDGGKENSDTAAMVGRRGKRKGSLKGAGLYSFNAGKRKTPSTELSRPPTRYAIEGES